ncbi:MAG: hypothetical protein SWE60_19925, partial [Thermodesulfobacteriota bacterium]|nr:hypothetical protein [Thermodesulfobacteriota bacterium]
SGDIDKFNVSFHYKSLPSPSNSPAPFQSILDSALSSGAESLWNPLFSTGGTSETPAPWYFQP